MKTLSKLINAVSFENALEKNSMHRIYENLNGTGKEVIPKSLKVYILAAFSWSICLISGLKGAGFPITASIIILGIFIGFIRSKRYFKNAAYTIAVYLITQTAVLFFFSVWMPWENPDMIRTYAILYILFGYGLSFYIIRIRLIENIQINYLIKDGKLIRKRKTIKILKIVAVILGLALVVAIWVTRFYTISSDWWNSSNNYDYSYDSLVGTVLYVFSSFIAFANLALFTLFPTVLLKTSVVLDGFIYKKYSLDFQKEYEFTDKEWYGE
ncbi:hypothetical protein AADZ52_13745 [Listeria welshimeri]|uniref:hypothetical protein n=1 Tax=Listeria welshimeri TaxID=1643 RepID=UPI001D020251|nr:hypothetical protein [Listeria welshimeri]